MLYSFSDRCGDLIAVDLAYGCATSLPFALERVSEMNASHGILTVIGIRGAVLELFLER